VNGTDYSRIDNAFLTNKNASNPQLTGWFNGGFNYDGVIDGSDYTLIDNSFNRQGPSFAATMAEPDATITAQIAPAVSVQTPGKTQSQPLADARVAGNDDRPLAQTGAFVPYIFNANTPIAFGVASDSVELLMQKKDVLDGLSFAQ